MTTRRVVIESCGANENQHDIETQAEEWVEQGTPTVSDSGAAYANFGSVIGSTHETVTHCDHFRDPITGVHTNDIEGRNALLKAFLKRLGPTFAISDDILWDYLAQYIWQQWYTNGTVTMQYGMFIISMYDQYGFV